MADPSGKFIKCGGYESFIPNPLPPEILWDESLARLLSVADRVVGQLSGEGRLLPNPHLLIRPFIKREAVLSSRIEGTRTSLSELMANDAGASVKQISDDLKEVGNYVRAMDYGIERLKALPLSLRLIREIHEKLMEGVRGDIATPGQFRKSQNWIGYPGCGLKNATYIPPSPDMLMDCMGQLEKFMHESDLPPLIQAALIHYQFEAIHPFLDGNGRVGRLLIILFLIEREVITAPLLYLSAFFEATRQTYYDMLLDVSYKSQWGRWLDYFLDGVAKMSSDALRRSEKINHQVCEWKKLMAGEKPKVLYNVIDIFSENPFWSIKNIASRLDVAYTTAQKAVKVLQDRQIIFQTDKEAQRGKVYCAEKIMEILNEPPEI